jgi:hypothetical protein
MRKKDIESEIKTVIRENEKIGNIPFVWVDTDDKNGEQKVVIEMIKRGKLHGRLSSRFTKGMVGNPPWVIGINENYRQIYWQLLVCVVGSIVGCIIGTVIV